MSSTKDRDALVSGNESDEGQVCARGWASRTHLGQAGSPSRAGKRSSKQLNAREYAWRSGLIKGLS